MRHNLRGIFEAVSECGKRSRARERSDDRDSIVLNERTINSNYKRCLLLSVSATIDQQLSNFGLSKRALSTAVYRRLVRAIYLLEMLFYGHLDVSFDTISIIESVLSDGKLRSLINHPIILLQIKYITKRFQTSPIC